ncbi:unnamed protein product [Urochloa humidicola]
MATLSSPPPPPLPSLDATPISTSPTPALTPSPAATSPSSRPASRSTPETATGRGKALRWSQDTPPSGKSGGGGFHLSFKEALLAARPVATTCAVAAPSVCSPRDVAPKILLRPAGARLPPPKLVPDVEGWLEAESHHSRKIRLRAERRPHRQVPTDLRGLCFNCFSPDHRAANCSSRPRCFKCKQLGHRARWCPNSGMVSHPEPAARLSTRARLRVLIWRRKEASLSTVGRSDGIGSSANLVSPPTGVAVASDPLLSAAGVPDGVGDRGSGGRRRWRRVRWRREKGHGAEGPAPPGGVGMGPEPLPTDGNSVGIAGDDAVTRPRRIIDRSARIARAEEELRCALSVMVIGDPAAVSVDGLAAEFAQRYDLPIDSLVFHRLSPNDLLLVLPSEEDAARVYNDGRPIQLPPITIHCRRWSRLKNATGVSLPQLIDVEVHGIPAHVWELETAEHLLDEWCCIKALHEDTVDRKDYSNFRLSTWCA